MVNCFNYLFVVDMSMWDRCSNMILNASVSDNKHTWGIQGGVESNVIERLDVLF